MGRRNRNKKNTGFYDGNYWQSADFNRRSFDANFDWLLSLALNRFRWVNLPDTCNACYLERVLLENGQATIAKRPNFPNEAAWVSVQAIFSSVYDIYGEPAEWRARGWGSTLEFDCSPENGVMIFNSNSRTNVWNGLNIIARRLAHLERTEDVNLAHQQTPWLITAPREKKLEVVNIYKQLQGGEPAILADDSFMNSINVGKIDTQVEYIGDKLNIAKQNLVNQAYLMLGIEHLAFQKGERMIEQEANGNNAPTTVRLMDSLQARRTACEKLNAKFGLNVQVYFNDDIESYNFNEGLKFDSAQEGE